MRVDEPCVSEATGARDRRVGLGGYPYWRMRLLYRPNRARGVVELEEPSLESNVVFGPEPFDEIERFDHPADLVPRVDAEAFKLDFAIAEPDAEDQPPLAHYVERRYFLRDLDRVEQRQQYDSENKLHIAGVCRKPAQQRHVLQRLVRWRKVMMARRDRVETGVTRQNSLLDTLSEAQHRRVGARMLRHHCNPEFHALNLRLLCRTALLLRSELVQRFVDKVLLAGIAIVEFGLAPRHPFRDSNHCGLDRGGDTERVGDALELVPKLVRQFEFYSFFSHRTSSI